MEWIESLNELAQLCVAWCDTRQLCHHAPGQGDKGSELTASLSAACCNFCIRDCLSKNPLTQQKTLKQSANKESWSNYMHVNGPKAKPYTQACKYQYPRTKLTNIENTKTL